MANYKVKKTRIVCEHKEILPPINSIYIDEKGAYHHGTSRCSAELDYIGTGQTSGSQTQIFFWCARCLEGVTLPLLAFMRVEIRVGDSRGYSRHSRHFRDLFSARDTVPAPAGDTHELPVVEVKNESPVLCRYCHCSHFVMPIHAATASAK